jgi:alpha-glucosidase (family GH31 glycosyl hydrolase)
LKGHVSRRRFLSAASVAAANGVVRRVFGQDSPAEWKPLRGFSIAGAEVEVCLTPISEATLRISLVAAGASMQPAAVFPAMGLTDRAWPQVETRLRGDGPHASMRWSGRQVVVTAYPFTVRVLDQEQRERQRLVFDEVTGRVSFSLHDRPVFGMGEGGHQFDRRGVVDAMRNGQFKPDQLLNGGRSPIPWLISPAGWALFFHHPMGTFDLTGVDGVFRPAEPPQEQDIFLVLADDPAQMLKEFALLSGMPHLPPVWALGYQQSHRTLGGREAVLEEAKVFREKKLPCDVMIYLGTGFAPSGWNTGHGSFAFNPKIFPDPVEMFREMHGEDFRVVLHVLGVPHDLHGRVSDRTYDADDVASYWREHERVFATGIDGWWVDDGDELFPEERLTRNRMYWEGALKERPNVRPYSLQRNGYAGLQRYGWIWSGDINSSWKALRTQIASGINTGLSGLPYWGTDTGGFFTTTELTAELYVRWFQFSAFCPLFRSHGRTWHLRLPWGWNEGDPGPVEDDAKVLPPREELHHPEVEMICRRYLNLRYQLLPYLYSMVYRTHRTGVPLMRALWMSFPGDARTVAVDDAYLWGDALLVAPVNVSGAMERTVYLPAGSWWDFWTQERIDGARKYTRGVKLADLPIYVRAGAIVPLGPVRQYATERSAEPIVLQVYPGADGEFSLYEDDGVSMDHLRGVSSVVEMRWEDGARRLTMRLAEGSKMHGFTSRRFVVRVTGEAAEKEILFDGLRGVWIL